MQENHVWGFVDKTGATVIPSRFQLAHDFSQGLASVKSGDKWGYIDSGGTVVIKPQFDLAYPFSNGLARVEMGDCNWVDRGRRPAKAEDCRFGYIDRNWEICLEAFELNVSD